MIWKTLTILATVLFNGGNSELRAEVAECLNLLLLKYFNQSTLLLFDGQQPDHNDKAQKVLLSNVTDVEDNISLILRFLANDLWTFHILNQKYLRTLQPFTEQDLHFTTENEYVYASLFIFGKRESGDYNKMARVFERLKNSDKYKRQYQSIIVLQLAAGTGRMAAKNAVQAMWRWMKTAQVLVMVIIEEQFWFYTWPPYVQPDCSEVKNVKLLDKWSNGSFVNNSNLFPNKLLYDFQGCPLKTMTDDCVPYTLPEDLGIETKLIDTLVTHYNFTLEKHFPAQGSVWTTFDKNGSLTGSFKHLYLQEIDFTYACYMLNYARFRIAENLPSYFDDSLSWFVALPAGISHTTDVYMAYDWQMWIAIGVTICISNIFVFFIAFLDRIMNNNHSSSFGSIILRFIFFSINTPTSFKTTSIAFRMIIIIYSLYSLNICTAYQASLYNLYRTQRHQKMYDNIRQAVADNMFVYLSEVNKFLYNQTDHDLWNQILAKGKHDYDPEYEQIVELVRNRHAATLYVQSTMLYIIQEYFTNKETHQPQMVYLPKRFVAYPITFYMSPGHPLFSIFHKFILNVGGAGLVKYWLSNVVHERRRIILKIMTNNALSFEHLSGPLYIWILILGGAAVTFTIEIMFGWYFKVRKNKKKLVEMSLGEMMNNDDGKWDSKRKKVIYVTKRFKI